LTASAIKSLDPRVNRLPGTEAGKIAKEPLDQLTNFEVFVQPKSGKPFQHEGAVHASDLEMAYILAKETFTRRFTCTSLCVAPTSRVIVSAMTEGSESAFDRLTDEGGRQTAAIEYEVYVLLRRGKQHVHAGRVEARSPADAMAKVKSDWHGKSVFNIWTIPSGEFRFTNDGDADLWHTLPEKKFRDAADYKGGDKLKQFLEKQK
jgi:ring-1,2-phenylacetyl-CoA epoxidase subunit PaaB